MPVKAKAKRTKHPRIEVREMGTRKLVRTIELHQTHPAYVERVLRGLLINLDTARFYAAEVDC